MKTILMVKKINDKFEPDYLKGWHEANSQFWVNKDKLFIDYEDDDQPGLTDVSNQYEWKLESKV